MILMSIYLLWRIIFTLPFGQGILNIIFGILLIAAETVTVLTTFELFIQKMQEGIYRIVRSGEKVSLVPMLER